MKYLILVPDGSGDEPIEALAMRIGLNDSKNLSRQFKTYKGMTPIEYKKRYKI